MLVHVSAAALHREFVLPKSSKVSEPSEARAPVDAALSRLQALAATAEPLPDDGSAKGTVVVTRAGGGAVGSPATGIPGTPAASPASSTAASPVPPGAVLLRKVQPSGLGQGTVVTALSMLSLRLNALLERNRAKRRLEPWFLVLSAQHTAAALHTAAVNCAFSALKVEAPIDVCVMAAGETCCPILQQAAHISRGIVSVPDEQQRAALHLHLVQALLILPSLRKVVKTLPERSVDLRATCAISGTPLDIGHVCTSCLAAFGQPQAVCPLCGAKYSV